MKYLTEFREASKAQGLLQAIHHEVRADKLYRLMEFCGGHTHAIHRYGIPALLPKAIELRHGPGCPVCVLPMRRIDQAIALAHLPGVIFCSYGDMLRVPGSHRQNLLQAKAQGADVRMVYSVDDALQIAQAHPQRSVIFFAIGFETTTPPTAVAIQQAQRLQLKNFSVFCNHVLTPVAMEALLQHTEGAEIPLEGFIGPAHVSIVIGSQAYANISQRYRKPIVIAGFEPLDILHSIWMLLRQINAGSYHVENQYTRAVTTQGSIRSQAVMQEVFEYHPRFEWRGLGWLPNSALKIRADYATFDAEQRFVIPDIPSREHKGCECAAVLQGIKKPTDCALFATACHPEQPLGACMVSSEGACAAVYAYSLTG